MTWWFPARGARLPLRYQAFSGFRLLCGQETIGKFDERRCDVHFRNEEEGDEKNVLRAVEKPSGGPRRSFLSTALGACAIRAPLGFASMQLAASMSGSLTKEQRDSMTPSQVIDELKKGNERFRAAKVAPRDYLAEKRSSAAGQYPAAVILGCLDSRVPAEIVFDAGIGDTFVGRVAGNVVNDDMLGSMEFACAVSGAQLVLVLGHTSCGAVKGAIDDVSICKRVGRIL